MKLQEMEDEFESSALGDEMTARRGELLQSLAERFDDPDGLDWDALRAGKQEAWPAPPERCEP